MPFPFEILALLAAASLALGWLMRSRVCIVLGVALVPAAALVFLVSPDMVLETPTTLLFLLAVSAFLGGLAWSLYGRLVIEPAARKREARRQALRAQ